jgi:hypothetical protein
VSAPTPSARRGPTSRGRPDRRPPRPRSRLTSAVESVPSVELLLAPCGAARPRHRRCSQSARGLPRHRFAAVCRPHPCRDRGVHEGAASGAVGADEGSGRELRPSRRATWAARCQAVHAGQRAIHFVRACRGHGAGSDMTPPSRVWCRGEGMRWSR